MSLDDDLQQRLRAALRAEADNAPTGAGLDAGAAIGRARTRRRPKVAIATGATALAAVGVLAISLPVILQPISMSSTSGGAPMSEQVELSQSDAGSDQSGEAMDTAIKRAPANLIAMCEGPMPFADLAEAPASMSGVTLEVFVEPTATITSGGTITVIARLTNPTSATITGATTTAAAGFLGVDGLTMWHSPTSSSAVDQPFSLAPGAAVDVPVTVAALICTADDDLAAYETGAFPDDLAPLGAGIATIVAALDVRVDDEGGPALLDLVVSGPVEVPITG